MTFIRQFLRYLFSVLLVALIILAPCILFSIKQQDFSFVLTSIVFAIPIVFLVLLIRNRFISILVISVLMIFSFIETVMIIDFDNFIVAGNILAVATASWEESASFVKNNWWALWGLLFFILILILIIVESNRIIGKKKYAQWSLVAMLLSIAIAFSFVLYKQKGFYHNRLTYRYYIENRILNRPPYNLPYQIRNAVKIQQRKKYISDSENFSFQSKRSDAVENRETYVLAIGESMRYDNVSLNGSYARTTTPNLESLENIILYSDYYSASCLTMFSVPQILTRATPKEYSLNFKEKAVYLPFKEVGFKTYAIVCNNLLGYESYLTSGVDSLYKVAADKDIPVIIDSLSMIYPKTFFIVQFLGNHSYYYNYEPAFNQYRPNINSDPDIRSDSLYINAYDNTILYSDYILSQIIEKINKPEKLSSLVFLSDHGENVSATGGGHGGDCKPRKTEYHVPLIFWFSDAYAKSFPEKIQCLKKHKDCMVSSDNIFYSVCDMANITIASQYSRDGFSVFSDHLEEPPRYILVPDGVTVIEVK